MTSGLTDALVHDALVLWAVASAAYTAAPIRPALFAKAVRSEETAGTLIALLSRTTRCTIFKLGPVVLRLRWLALPTGFLRVLETGADAVPSYLAVVVLEIVVACRVGASVGGASKTVVAASAVTIRSVYLAALLGRLAEDIAIGLAGVRDLVALLPPFTVATIAALEILTADSRNTDVSTAGLKAYSTSASILTGFDELPVFPA